MNMLGQKSPASGRMATVMWAALALAVLLGIVWSLPLPDASARLQGLPENGLLYTSLPLKISPAEQEFFGAATVQRRQMRLGGASFTLTVVDGTRNRHAVHDPLHCFQSSGYHVGAGTTVPLRQGEGRSVCVSNPDGKATVLFWFSDGCSRHASPWRYWWQATCRRITRGLSSSEPVLVILSIPGDATAAWPEILARCPEVMTL